MEESIKINQENRESVNFESEEDFREKLQTIRENYFDGPKEVITETAGLDDDPIEIDDEEKK